MLCDVTFLVTYANGTERIMLARKSNTVVALVDLADHIDRRDQCTNVHHTIVSVVVEDVVWY